MCPIGGAAWSSLEGNLHRSYKSIGVIIVQSTHIKLKFIRPISHSVVGNDLIGLLKSHIL